MKKAPRLDCHALDDADGDASAVRATERPSRRPSPRRRLLAVCDATQAGRPHAASRLLTERLRHELPAESLPDLTTAGSSARAQIQAALQRTNTLMHEVSQLSRDDRSLSATITIAYLDSPHALLATVGPVRGYHVRTDHLEVLQPQDRQLDIELGGPDGRVRIAFRQIELNPGDALLLTSEEVDQGLDADQVIRAIAAEPTAAGACHRLISAAQRTADQDLGIAVARVQAPGEAMTQHLPPQGASSVALAIPTAADLSWCDESPRPTPEPQVALA